MFAEVVYSCRGCICMKRLGLSIEVLPGEVVPAEVVPVVVVLLVVVVPAEVVSAEVVPLEVYRCKRIELINTLL